MRLRLGAAHFVVDELPAYPPGGAGEHLYVRIEKEGLNTDDVAEALARAMRRSVREVGYAGRKDRAAIARQWFSVQLGDEAGLASLAAPGSGRIEVLEVSRHRNKLRLGHLRGNRFRLGLEGADEPGAAAALGAGLARLSQDGVANRFGPQRFGSGGVNVAIARAWAAGDVARAAALCVDPVGAWRPGEPLPAGFRPGLMGRVVGRLRRAPDDPEKALHAAGHTFRILLASAAQSAVFNAVFDARSAAGLVHVPRAGDVLRRRDGGLFRLAEADLADARERAAPGRLELLATAPLPGDECYAPSPEVDREERAWSAAAGIDWAWFERGRALASRGDRRELVAAFVEPPALEVDGANARFSFALPPGSYATEVLAQCGVEVPERRVS
jgi:tRNA pseudouridine13 synthase